MFHAIEENRLYDFTKEIEVKIDIQKGKEKYDVCQFLDDISVWMDENRKYVSEKYLPFSVLAVGITPIQISAFLYGVFAGKAMEKNKVKLIAQEKNISKDNILKKMEKNLGKYTELFGDIMKEKKNDKEKGARG